MKPNCTHCKFYAPVEDSGTVLDYGACRRHPPVPVADGEGEVVTVFPTVNDETVCGDWSPKQ